MRVKIAGEILEISDGYAARLMEQGKAIPAGDAPVFSATTDITDTVPAIGTPRTAPAKGRAKKGVRK